VRRRKMKYQMSMI